MYKVLIVDDETLAIRFLSALVNWNDEGFETPMTAMTAARATELFRQYRFDVVLADVRMPETDGITLVDQLREINPDCAFLILTAYRDFEVLRRSLQANVDAFLLKHEVDAALLADALRQATERLDKDRRLRRAALSHWLAERLYYGKSPAIPREVLAGYLDRQLLILKQNQWAFLDEDPGEAPVPSTPVHPLLAEALFANGVRCQLWAVPEGEALETPPGMVLENAVVLASKRYRTLAEVPDSALIRQLEGSLLLSGLAAMSFDAYVSMPFASPAFPQDYVKHGMELFQAGSEKLTEWARKPLDGLEERALCRMDGFLPLRQLLAALRDALTEDDPDQDGSLARGRLSGFTYCRGLDDVRECLARGIAEALEQGRKDADVGGEYARRAAEIIRSDYGSQLHTADIAGRLYISEGYLRAVFKKRYGCTISEYLRRTRVEAACELLKAGKYRAYEIADMCGFANSQHFNQVFRQEKGMSPRQYSTIGSR